MCARLRLLIFLEFIFCPSQWLSRKPALTSWSFFLLQQGTRRTNAKRVFFLLFFQVNPHPAIPSSLPTPFTSMLKLTPQESFHLAHPTHYGQLIPGNNRPTHYPIQVTPPNHISLHLAHSTSPNVPFRILSGTTGSDLPLLSFRSSALGTQAWHVL